MDGEQGVATIRFSKNENAEPIFQDIKDGIRRNISVGFDTHEFKELEPDEKTGFKVFLAIDWEPIELSSVPAGADNGAKVRSSEAGTTLCTFNFNESANEEIEPSITLGETEMTEKEKAEKFYKWIGKGDE